MREQELRCPSCGRKLNRAEQLWLRTHGGRQCSHCSAGAQFARVAGQSGPHAAGAKKGARARRGDRRLAA